MDSSNMTLIGSGLPYCAVTAEIFVKGNLIKTVKLAPSLKGCINEVTSHLKHVENIDVSHLALFVISNIDSAEEEVTTSAEFFHRCMSSYHCGNGVVKVYFMEKEKAKKSEQIAIPLGWTSRGQSEDRTMEQLQKDAQTIIDETRNTLELISRQAIFNMKKQSEVIKKTVADSREDVEFAIRGYQQQMKEYQQKLSRPVPTVTVGFKKGYAHSATCDECEDSINGRRFKCLVCPDYDLCSKCEAEGLHSHHALLRTTHPRETIVPIYVREGMAKTRKEEKKREHSLRSPSPDFVRSRKIKLPFAAIPRVDQMKTPKLFAPNEMLAKLQLAEKALESYREQKLQEQKQRYEKQLITLKENCLRTLDTSNAQPLVKETLKTGVTNEDIKEIDLVELTKAVEKISAEHKVLHETIVKNAERQKEPEVDIDESDSSSIISLDSIEDFEDDEIEESRQVLPERIETAIEPTDEEEGLHTAVAPTPEPAAFNESDGTKTALPLGADQDGCMTAVAPTPEPVAYDNRIATFPIVPVFTPAIEPQQFVQQQQQGQSIRLPIAHVQTASADATASALLEMGFSFTEIQKALSSCGVGVEKCVQFILHKGY